MILGNMTSQENQEFDFVNSRKDTKVSKDQLLFVNHVAQLSDAQKEFNRLMKRLEKERAKHDLEEKRLDAMQKQIIEHIMPLIEECNLMNRDICILVRSALDRIKFSPRQRALLEDLLCGKARDLLDDPVGLSQDDCTKLITIIRELIPDYLEESDEEFDDFPDEDFDKKVVQEQFDQMRADLENFARLNSLDLDLSDLDPNGDQKEFQRKLNERLRAVEEQILNKGISPNPPRKRKPTRAQQEKERKRLEQEEAKQKDLKSLYKQLAKAIHPDLEKDPEMKLLKEAWMKRLTAAHAAGDLSELLRIEMEWLGEESDNLAKASEEKLKIYHAVLKEQIRDVRNRAQALIFQPQFQILGRFIDPLMGNLPPFAAILAELKEDHKIHRAVLQKLHQGDTAVRNTLKDWAYHHRKFLDESDIPF